MEIYHFLDEELKKYIIFLDEELKIYIIFLDEELKREAFNFLHDCTDGFPIQIQSSFDWR